MLRNYSGTLKPAFCKLFTPANNDNESTANVMAVTPQDINICKSIEDGPCMGRQGNAPAGDGLDDQ